MALNSIELGCERCAVLFDSNINYHAIICNCSNDDYANNGPSISSLRHASYWDIGLPTDFELGVVDGRRGSQGVVDGSRKIL